MMTEEFMNQTGNLESNLDSILDKTSLQLTYRQCKREVQCAMNLAEKLQEYVEMEYDESGDVNQSFIKMLTSEAEELAQDPLGRSLLSVVGYVYTEQALSYLGFKHSVYAGSMDEVKKDL